MLKPFLTCLIAAVLLATPAAAQPGPAPAVTNVTLNFERTDLGIWSAPAGWISDDTLMLGVPQSEREPDAKLWFWSRARGIFSQDIPAGAEGIADSGCATRDAIVWVASGMRGNREQSHLRRLDVVNGEVRLSGEQFSPVRARPEIVSRHYTVSLSGPGPEIAIFFARGACRLVSTHTLHAVVQRTPSLQQGSHVQFTSQTDGRWRAAPMQERRMAPNAISIDYLAGRPYVEFDASFQQIGEGEGALYDVAFETPIGRYAFYPEHRGPGVVLADGRLWRVALSNPTPDGCIVFQASHVGNMVMLSGPFTPYFPKYQYHVIDLCSPANRAVFAAAAQ